MAHPHLFKLNRRARSTIWSLALCTMVIVASFTLASGLRNSATVLRDAFPQEYSLVTHPVGGSLGSFDGSLFAEFEPRTAFGLYKEVVMEPGGVVVGAIMIVDQHAVLPTSIATMENNSVLVGPDVPVTPGQFMFNLSGVPVVDTGGFWSPMFSNDWILGSQLLLRQLTGIQSGFNFAIVQGLTSSDYSSLSSEGFQVHPMVGIIEFLDFSVREVGSDSYWILVPSAFAIAILAYSFIGSETADRRHEIGVLKAIGAGRRAVFAAIMSNAILIGALGGLLGLALGIIASYGIATLASGLFSAVLVIRISEWLLLIALAATMLAAFLGALAPALKMTRTRPEADLREVPV